MDVGATVGNIAFITAIFALMSYIALSVELGSAPEVKEGKKSRGLFGFSKGPKVSQENNKLETTDLNLDRTIDTTKSQLTDGVARSQLKDDQDGSNLNSLRARFIDGFLGPRIKYDVALTTLYESQNESVKGEDDGKDVATRAFLDATQSIVISEDS